MLSEVEEALDAENEDEGDHQVHIFEYGLRRQGFWLGRLRLPVDGLLLRHQINFILDIQIIRLITVIEVIQTKLKLA